MKKIVCIALSIVLLLVLFGCSSSTPPTSTNTVNSPSPADVGTSTAPSTNQGSADSSNTVSRDDWIKIEYTFATYLPESNFINRVFFNEWLNSLEKHMPGYVNITMYASGTLLAQPDIYDGVKIGTADIGFLDLSQSTNKFPLSTIWSLPTCFTGSSVAAAAAITEWIQKYQPAEFDDFVVLHGYASSPTDMVSSFPVNGVSDFAGKQIRASATLAPTILAFGGIPVTIDTSELYEAARSNMIQGAYYGLAMAQQTGCTEFLNYATFLDMGSIPYAFLMNKDSLAKMPESQQEAFLMAIREAFWETSLYLVQPIMMEDPVLIKALADGEITLNVLPDATLKELHDAAAFILKDKITELDAMGFAGEETVNQITELVQKWAAWYPMTVKIDSYQAAAEGRFEEHVAKRDSIPYPDMPEVYGYTPSDKR